jgi:asparagine synthase (glutamine-hydrolysing)
MCGLCGYFAPEGGAASDEAAGAVAAMTALMVRRGPDDDGAWSDDRCRLGFRRLAILDLTPAGHQPMVSSDGRSVIVFNGELYNFPTLRRELEAEGSRFRSRSDTEVVLEALVRWGEAALPRLNGMFALAWYVPEARRLLLARDHAGIKPLYWSTSPDGRALAFASQYDALLRAPWGRALPIDPDALATYLWLHHVPPPQALHRGVRQLEAGHYLVASPEGVRGPLPWSTLPIDPEPDPKLVGDAALEAVAAALDDAVRRQRVADVPVGVFLSGGVDSALVTATAARQSEAPVRAFTIGNPGWWQDEGPAASVYAAHLGVRHTLENVSGERALGMLDDVFTAQREPFGDYSSLPTLLVSQVARRDVTVALSGDGGDELFFGYERPMSLLRNGRDFRWSYGVRRALWIASRLRLGPRRSEAVTARDPGDYYLGVNSRLRAAGLAAIAPSLRAPSAAELYRYPGWRGERHLAGFSRWAECRGQLQRGLKKVDLASMHVSLEVRVPLLDREVLDVSLRIAPDEHMRGGERKSVLRRLLARHVPDATIGRQKRGFAVPLGEWLRGPLRPLVEAELLARDPYPAGVFDRQGLRKLYDDHLAQRADAKWTLWTLLSLARWAKVHAP